MINFNGNIEIVVIEGGIALLGYILNYIASRKNREYARVSFKSLVYDCYFIYSHEVNLKNYLSIFFGNKNLFPPLSIAMVVFLLEVFLTIYNETAGFFLLLIALILLFADILINGKHKVKKTKEKYLPLVMTGTQLQDRKTKREPFLYSVVRYLVLSNGYALITFLLAVIVISFYDPKFTLSPSFGILFDIFFGIYLIGLISPRNRDFRWLNYNLILNEIDKEDDIYLRIHLDYPGASASLPLEGELVQIQPKMIIKTSDDKSDWYETVHWKQIKRISVRLVKRNTK